MTMVSTISWIEFVWIIMMSYGLYRTSRSIWYTHKVRLFWITQELDEGRVLNGKTDMYTFDRLRSTLLRFGQILLLWLAGVTSATFPPRGVEVNPEWVAMLPILFIVVAGVLTITDSHYSELTQRRLLEYDEFDDSNEVRQWAANIDAMHITDKCRDAEG